MFSFKTSQKATLAALKKRWNSGVVNKTLAVLELQLAHRDARVRTEAKRSLERFKNLKSLRNSDILLSIVLNGLSDGKPKIRECAIAACSPSFLEAAVPRVAELLEDNVLSVALAAAHQLWYLARYGIDLGEIYAILDAARNSKYSQVGYFATLALTNHINRHCPNEVPPQVPRLEDNNLPDIRVERSFSYDGRRECRQEPHYGKRGQPIDKQVSERCEFCGSLETQCIFSDGCGSNDGWDEYSEYECLVCSMITIISDGD